MKELNDKFLPYWNVSSLKRRVGLTKEQASLFLAGVRELQRKHAIPKAAVPSAGDYDLVVSHITLGEFGDQQRRQHHIDEHVREHGVMCSNSTVYRRLHGLLTGNRRRNLSKASIDMITDLLYAATSATDCKPANSARHFVRAFAMLERRYGSAAEYLLRNRELPADQITQEGSRSRVASLPIHYPHNAEFSSSHPGFRYSGVDSQSQAEAVRQSQSSSQTQASHVSTTTQGT